MSRDDKIKHQTQQNRKTSMDPTIRMGIALILLLALFFAIYSVIPSKSIFVINGNPADSIDVDFWEGNNIELTHHLNNVESVLWIVEGSGFLDKQDSPTADFRLPYLGQYEVKLVYTKKSSSKQKTETKKVQLKCGNSCEQKLKGKINNLLINVGSDLSEKSEIKKIERELSKYFDEFTSISIEPEGLKISYAELIKGLKDDDINKVNIKELSMSKNLKVGNVVCILNYNFPPSTPSSKPEPEVVVKGPIRNTPLPKPPTPSRKIPKEKTKNPDLSSAKPKPSKVESDADIQRVSSNPITTIETRPIISPSKLGITEYEVKKTLTIETTKIESSYVNMTKYPNNGTYLKNIEAARIEFASYFNNDAKIVIQQINGSKSTRPYKFSEGGHNQIFRILNMKVDGRYSSFKVADVIMKNNKIDYLKIEVAR